MAFSGYSIKELTSVTSSRGVGEGDLAADDSSTGIALAASSWTPKSHEILMFVCLQKDAKRCCGGTKGRLCPLFWETSVDQNNGHN